MLPTRAALAAGLLALILIGCTTAATGPTPSTSVDPDAIHVVARDLRFEPTVLEVPAGEQFTLSFDNQEGLPHNVAILDASGASMFTGEIFTGPAQRTQVVPALAAGSYTFLCSVHPDMKGSLTAT